MAQLAWLCLFVARMLSSVPPPRINIRWRAGTSEIQRGTLAREWFLDAPRIVDASTSSYDLRDESMTNLNRIVSSPAVEDTHFIDRGQLQVVADAPRGVRRWWAERYAGGRFRAAALGVEWLTLAAAFAALAFARSRGTALGGHRFEPE